MADQGAQEGRAASVGGSARSGIAWTGAGQIVKQVFEFGVGIAMARLLSPREFGIMSASTIFISFVAIFTSFGVSSAIIQRAQMEEGYLRTAQTLSVAFGCFSTLLMAASAPLIGRFFKNAEIAEVVPILSLMFLISGFNAVPSALLTRGMNFNKLTTVSVLGSLVYGITCVSLALAGFGVWSLILGTLASLVAVTLASSAFCSYFPRFSFDGRHFRELCSFGGLVTVSSLLNHLARNADNLIVGRFLGPASLGLYARAYSLATTTKEILVAVFGSVLFPSFSRMQDDHDKVRAAYLKSVQALCLISLPASVLLCLAGPEIVNTVYGPKWVDIITPLRILSLAGFIYTLYIPCTALLLALGKTRTYTKLQMFYSAAIVLSVLAVTGYGIDYIATAVSLAIFICYCPYYYSTHKILNIGFGEFVSSMKTTIYSTSCAGIMFVTINALVTFDSQMTKLACELLVCAPVYLIAILTLGDDVALELFATLRLKLRRA
jgi:O-antigen/teichoic acid export membrane protein